MKKLSEYLDDMYVKTFRKDRHETVREEVLLTLAFYGKMNVAEIQEKMETRGSVFDLEMLIDSIDKIYEQGECLNYIVNFQDGLKYYFLSNTERSF